MCASKKKWKFPDKKFICEKTVLFRQTNVFGNTYFANYIDWQGEARERFLLEHPDVREFFQSNQSLKLVTHSLHHRFIENVYFSDRVRIEVTSKAILKFSFTLIFEYYNSNTNSLIGKGWQKIGFYDDLKKEICPIPELFLDLIEPVRI